MVESRQQETNLERGKKLMRNYSSPRIREPRYTTNNNSTSFHKALALPEIPFLALFRLIRQDVSIYANKHTYIECFFFFFAKNLWGSILPCLEELSSRMTNSKGDRQLTQLRAWQQYNVMCPIILWTCKYMYMTSQNKSENENDCS
jgi:hypothetical protein